MLLYGLLNQFEELIERLLLPTSRVDLQVKILRYNEQVGHLVLVHLVGVQQPGQGRDEVRGQRDLIVLNLFLFPDTKHSAGRPAANRRVSRRRLTDATDHDLDERGLLAIIQILLFGPRLLDQQVRHALPVLHHGVALYQGVHEVGAVLMQLRLDEELHQVPDERGVGKSGLTAFGPEVDTVNTIVKDNLINIQQAMIC